MPIMPIMCVYILACSVLGKCLIDQFKPREAQSLLQESAAFYSQSGSSFDKSLGEDP